MITIIDYGMGNVGSIKNMLKKAGVESIITDDLAVISAADKLILPGVGSFDHGMKQLADKGLKAVLDRKVLEERTPILGICLGMQLFTAKSEEGQLPGLGWIQAETKKFDLSQVDQSLKIPHMGWNLVKPVKDSVLLKNIFDEPRFYFVHTYHVVCTDPGDVLTHTRYGYDFVSSFCRDNIVGVQFHPEKSHKYGLKLLKNFAEHFYA